MCYYARLKRYNLPLEVPDRPGVLTILTSDYWTRDSERSPLRGPRGWPMWDMGSNFRPWPSPTRMLPRLIALSVPTRPKGPALTKKNAVVPPARVGPWSSESVRSRLVSLQPDEHTRDTRTSGTGRPQTTPAR